MIAALTWQAWVTIGTVLLMFAALIFTKIRTDIAFLSAISVFYISGVLDIKEAFCGFSSESVVVVGVLFVVIAGLTYSGVLNWIVKNIMGVPKTLTGTIVRLMIPVAALSSLLSNTTVVALFINVVKMWSKKLGIAPSKLLIPLSYASGMGGICTLIGTPPNLIISGLYTEETGIKLSILTPTICGLFCLAVGILSVIALQKLLPERKSLMKETKEEDFTGEFTVPYNNIYIGQKIQTLTNFFFSSAQSNNQHIGQPLNENNDSAYSNENDVILLALIRSNGKLISPVPPEEIILKDDRLILSGKIHSLRHVTRKLSLKAPILNGVLDTSSNEEFKSSRTIVSSLILLAMVLLSAFNVLPLLACCLLAAAAMMVCKCCTPNQAMKSIDWSILIVFAGSVAIGKAIELTGLAQMAAEGLLSVCGSNPYVVLTAVCFVATFVTEFISNTAAAAMFYPIAMSTALSLGVNPLTFCVALMIAVSSSFATPIGSPTHMLVYNPGGYRFTDFMKIGLIMNVIILIADIFITTLVFPF